MTTLERELSFRFPLMRGDDVRSVQQALIRADVLSGSADGIFGPATRDAVITFQRQLSAANPQFKVDGVVGRNTWSALNPERAPVAVAPAAGPPGALLSALPWRDTLRPYLDRIGQRHGAPCGNGRVDWLLEAGGIRVFDGASDSLPRSGGAPKTAQTTWSSFRPAFEKCAAAFGVPVEVLVATACTESGGKPDVIRKEPGYVDDESTPNRISPGLMQTLISTARSAIGDPGLSRAALLDPDTSIRAGAAYIKQQATRGTLPTNFDPPLVGVAYNAGSLRASTTNRWGLVQTDRGGGKFHADAWVEYFNDLFAVLAQDAPDPRTPSYWTLLNKPV
jgi:hypothetical protein